MKNDTRNPNPALPPDHTAGQVRPWHRREISGSPYWLVLVTVLTIVVILAVAFFTSSA